MIIEIKSYSQDKVLGTNSTKIGHEVTWEEKGEPFSERYLAIKIGERDGYYILRSNKNNYEPINSKKELLKKTHFLAMERAKDLEKELGLKIIDNSIRGR